MLDSVGLTIRPLGARKLRFDQRLRAWVRREVKDQQTPLGEALEKAGAVPLGRGQVWVSRYSRGGPATATIDHLIVIAGFFERSLVELLAEIGYKAAADDEPRRGAIGGNAEQVRAFLKLPAEFRAWALRYPESMHSPGPLGAAPTPEMLAGGHTKSARGPRR